LAASSKACDSHGKASSESETAGSGQAGREGHGADHDRPQVDEDDLHVEGHEEQRVEVEGQAESAPRVTDGVDPALVGQALLESPAPMRDEPREQDRAEDEDRRGDAEADDVHEPGLVHR